MFYYTFISFPFLFITFPTAFRGDISVKLDTFSFGVIILELLTGLPPYDEDRDGNDLVSNTDLIIYCYISY